ncbi:MAG: hypothetical protein L0Y73_00825 [Candidatus Aminicenantes bacterium]|nr:hypothetical protein [Candidatus Aminicenantes bacterium]
MLAERREASDYFGSLAGLPDAHSINTVVIFVEEQLGNFSHQYSGSAIKNEKGLTQKLCQLLNRNARKKKYPFWFEKEYMEDEEIGNSPQVDIAVIDDDDNPAIDSIYYNTPKSFFVMEAKRLDKISTIREKEYLVGRMEENKYKDCGGVERFKKEIHGRGLRCGAMIGYVQAYHFDHWLTTINSWIDDLIDGKIFSSVSWSEKDKLLEQGRSPETARFSSENSRSNGVIHLHHLWVNLAARA